MNKILKSAIISFILLLAAIQSAYAWCVLNDSVLPLAVFGEPKSSTKRGQIENLNAEIKCLEAKKMRRCWMISIGIIFMDLITISRNL